MVCPGCLIAVGTWAGLYGFSAMVRFKADFSRRRDLKRVMLSPCPSEADAVIVEIQRSGWGGSIL